ncbi:MAG: hypothetical protein HY647_07040 [Acidobacteria bacterium]|nr:hypothetical protein [Acidobacteriota bacterium]
MSTDWHRAELSPADRAMLEFGEKLTLLPSDMTEEDVVGLRRRGFTDREVLSIVLAAAYRNFITRVADALGVELRRSGAYTPEILRAFGVTEVEARTTMYGDRVKATEEQGEMFRPQIGPGPLATTAQGVCWIETASPETGQNAQLRQQMERLTQPHSRRHLALAFSLRPEALGACLAFGRLVGLGGSGHSRRLEAIVGLVTAARLSVPYLGVHHAQALLDAGGTADEVRALAQDPSGGLLSGQEREVARFCDKVTRVPSSMACSDIEALRHSGLDDRDIVTVAASAAFENFLGRVAAGLGVRLEEDVFASAALEAFQVAASL